jgi:hypothetical protein
MYLEGYSTATKAHLILLEPPPQSRSSITTLRWPPNVHKLFLGAIHKPDASEEPSLLGFPTNPRVTS